MRLRALRDEFPPLLSLALPLILGELGWVGMSVVDTAMLGRTASPSLALAASALAQVMFNTLAFGTGGVLLSLDTLISQAFGEEDQAAANHWLLHGVTMAILLAVLLVLVVWAMPLLLWRFPVDHAVLRAAVPALRGLDFGVLPLLLYFALRRYLQAAHQGRTIMAALVSANIVNAAGDWLLIYGHHWHVASHTLDVPAFGVAGSAWATSGARGYLAFFLGCALFLANKRQGYGLRSTERHLDRHKLLQIVRLGAPVGAQIFVEVAIFALATAVIATFGPLPLAAHEIALQLASVTYMVPLAVSAATSVRVGRAVGRLRADLGSSEAIAAAGWSGILLGAGFMLLAALVFVLFPGPLAALFTDDTAVITASTQLLLIAAAFQFFDGVQSTATGALRGAGRTLAPLVVQATCFWAIAMPLGCFLALARHGGARGMWWGLAWGLVPAALVLLVVWQSTCSHPDRLALPSDSRETEAANSL